MARPLIIRVRANEQFARKANRPNVPITPDEIIQDAIECEAAGACIYHWHGRDPVTEDPSHDPELYMAVYRGLRDAHAQIVRNPTLGSYLSSAIVTERLKYALPSNGDASLRAEFVPIDMGSVNVDRWNLDKRDWVSTNKIYKNPTDHLIEMFTEMNKHNLRPTLGLWNPGQVRVSRLLQEMGLIPDPVSWELILSTIEMPSSQPATKLGLESMVDEIPEGQPWTVMCTHGQVLELASWAIPMGGNIAIGLGDDAFEQFGTPRNADLVQHIAELGKDTGRPIVTPAEVRTLFKLPKLVV
jgi:3-keto-5-aminohexanoate cleavage enzyme